MNILMMEWNSFGREDIKTAFERQGHKVISVPFSKTELRHDENTEREMSARIRKESPDVVFSFNYFPIIALVCNKEDVPYISWVYDSPYVMLYSYTTIFPCNHIFLFDRSWVEEFHRNHIMTVNYLPMAADAKRLAELCKETGAGENERYRADVSFVGSLYRGRHDFYGRMKTLDEYTRGYLEAVIRSQMQIYGADIVERCMTPEVITNMQKALPLETFSDGVESLSYLYGQYVIDREITSRERYGLLGDIAEKYGLTLYSNEKAGDDIMGVKNRGPVDYYDKAPLAYRNAKVNLNITLRSIKSGMPLRVFEIMGSEGFLLTNYQADFDGSFTAGEDYVYFDSREDLLDKCGYYLMDAHEAERKEIAHNGYEKVLGNHTYDHRVREMLASI